MSQREIDIDAVIRRFVKPGAQCLDIGAGHGKHTKTMLECSQKRVVVIEPAPANQRVLSDRFGPDEISLLMEGLSDHDCDRYILKCPGACPVNHGITDVQEGSDPTHLSTLDTIWAHSMLGNEMPLHFIKIDVEGMEFEVFKGGLHTLWKHRPVVVFETRYGFQSVRGGLPLFACIKGLLSGIGYSLWSFDMRGLFPADLEKLDSDTLALPDDVA